MAAFSPFWSCFPAAFGCSGEENLTVPFIEKHAAQTGGPADLMLSDMTFKSGPAPQKAPRYPPPPPSYLGLTPLWSATHCRLQRGGVAMRELAQTQCACVCVRVFPARLHDDNNPITGSTSFTPFSPFIRFLLQ